MDASDMDPNAHVKDAKGRCINCRKKSIDIVTACINVAAQSIAATRGQGAAAFTYAETMMALAETIGEEDGGVQMVMEATNRLHENLSMLREGIL
jgi:hypothetical protein